MNEERITYFAQTDARNKKVNFGIKAKDRSKHVYVIGKTGMGKSTLLENIAVQDIKNGEGLAFIDPHGKTADLLLEYIPPERVKDVVYFAPFDTDHPISFNVLESVDPDKRHLVVSGLMSTFKKIWQDAWSARMEYILTNTLLALLEYPDATLLGVNRMLSDKKFREKVVSNVTDPAVKSFWTEEFAHYTERMAAEAVPAIQNKIGQFTANALIRNMIGQAKSSFNIREIMDSKKIMIINLSKGRVGETNANLLGGMLITKIYLAALSRADVPDRALKELPNFYLFVDEFQSFANESFADILSEARKYKLNLTMAHQYIEQMEEEVRAAVFGNVGTMIVFRVGAYDAEILEKEFAPQFTAEDIVNLGFAQIYLKLMIDGISSPPFSATTLPPIPQPETSSMQEAIEMSRRQFSRSRAEVEKAISDWHEPIIAPPKPRTELKQEVKSEPKQEPKQEPRPQSRPPAPQHQPQPPSTHQPFKNALIQAPVSLSTLSSKTHKNQDQNASKPGQKEASPERVNELRNALASVLGKKEVPKETPKEAPKESPKETVKDVPKEISSEELKKVLKID
ncbi:MAG: type IV secretion system DNA-binding domain-containing protein [bacterium]|nr:type IV secretion system DNA-binding domain-containing protein [bacterium]